MCGKPKRNASVCGTCSKEQASASKIAQYVELVRAGLEVRGVSHLHKFITAYTGYTHSVTSLRRHLVDCLGLKPGD